MFHSDFINAAIYKNILTPFNLITKNDREGVLVVSSHFSWHHREL